MTLGEWIDHVVEQAVESATCSAALDPFELICEVEHEVIVAFGVNLNQKQVKELNNEYAVR